jgi:hypothetical protein
VGAFGLDYAGTEGVDPDLFRAELAGQHDGDGVVWGSECSRPSGLPAPQVRE